MLSTFISFKQQFPSKSRKSDWEPSSSVEWVASSTLLKKWVDRRKLMEMPWSISSLNSLHPAGWRIWLVPVIRTPRWFLSSFPWQFLIVTSAGAAREGIRFHSAPPEWNSCVSCQPTANWKSLPVALGLLIKAAALLIVIPNRSTANFFRLVLLFFQLVKNYPILFLKGRMRVFLLGFEPSL